MSIELSEKAVQKFDCELCLENYNLYDKKAHSLVPCGHAICLSCFNNLQKQTCPFCRIKIDGKIPNWEILKRLPKPSIPIIYYQVEIKMNSLKSVVNEFSSIIVKLNSELKEKIQMAITDNEIKGDEDISEKLKLILKKIDDNHQENLELESSLTKLYESLKNKIDLDENKYNNENLKKFKNDIEKLTIKTMDKINVLQKELSDFNQLFNVYNSKPSVDFIRKLEKMFLESDKPEPINQQLHSLFSANIIRPVSNPVPSDPNSPTNPDTESLNFSTRQKVVIVTVVFIILLILMIYPVAMILIGATNLNECPINYLIPIWLVVGGGSGIIVEMQLGILFIYTLFRTFRHRTFAEKMVFIFLIVVPFSTILVFNIAWFFTGNAWIYPLHKNVQSEDKNKTSTYCGSTVFYFSFWTLNLAYIVFAITLIVANLICCCICFFKK